MRKNILRKEKKERLMRKWIIKDRNGSVAKTPQRVVWEITKMLIIKKV